MATGESSREEATHKGGHRSDGCILTSRIVDTVATEGKVCRKEGNALGFTCSIHPTHDKLSLGGEEGEENTGGHGEQVEVPAARQCMGS